MEEDSSGCVLRHSIIIVCIRLVGCLRSETTTTYRSPWTDCVLCFLASMSLYIHCRLLWEEQTVGRPLPAYPSFKITYSGDREPVCLPMSHSSTTFLYIGGILLLHTVVVLLLPTLTLLVPLEHASCLFLPPPFTRLVSFSLPFCML